jgi:hypothetical protein
MGLDISIIDGVLIITDENGFKIAQLHQIINIYQYEENKNLGTPKNLKLVDNYNERFELDAPSISSISGVPFVGSYNDLLSAVLIFQQELNNPASVLPLDASTKSAQLLQTAELIKQTAANDIFHEEILNPINKIYSDFKKISFICSGSIAVTVDGNTITYPKNLIRYIVYGESFEVDVNSNKAINFNGTGTVLVTIQK